MLTASNKSELLNVLAGIDISVPRRTEGRTKDHTERYAISHMLSALAGGNHLSYPINLTQRERPDFLLVTDSVKIGIEHTEAVPQNEAHKTVLRENAGGSEVYFISHHKPGEIKKTAKHLKKEIEENRAGNGWAGDSVEREWPKAMFHFINTKIDTLMKEGFERFNKDWLLIYDNWSLPALDREEAVPILLKLSMDNGSFEKFDHIYIITGNRLYEFSSTGVTPHEINDLWN